ncbi:hypothetical protein R3P38DRAFT_3204735 [Favolaschia claudopus]|uniref:Uncharacterized protein n=1 Tax=Favolaschia claudopus TaxID=2862362 RepID=A0AAW0AQ36_9AGAR
MPSPLVSVVPEARFRKLIRRGLFDTNVAIIQASATHLLVYVPGLGLVIIAWPQESGVAVPPDHIHWKLLMMERKWPCNCALKRTRDSDELLSCRIVSLNELKVVVAVCHYEEPRCQFFLNLTALYQTAFRHLPPGTADLTTQQLESQSRIGQILHTRLFDNSDNMAIDAEIGQLEIGQPLFFKGYLGEPGRQLGYPFFGSADDFLAPYFLQSKVVNGERVIALSLNCDYTQPIRPAYLNPTDLSILSDEETKILNCLANGGGISHRDLAQFAHRCENCGMFFAAGYIDTHSNLCLLERPLRRSNRNHSV